MVSSDDESIEQHKSSRKNASNSGIFDSVSGIPNQKKPKKNCPKNLLQSYVSREPAHFDSDSELDEEYIRYTKKLIPEKTKTNDQHSEVTSGTNFKSTQSQQTPNDCNKMLWKMMDTILKEIGELKEQNVELSSKLEALSTKIFKKTAETTFATEIVSC